MHGDLYACCHSERVKRGGISKGNMRFLTFVRNDGGRRLKINLKVTRFFIDVTLCFVLASILYRK